MTFRLVPPFVLLCLILSAPVKQSYAYFPEIISSQSILFSQVSTLARCRQNFSPSLQPKESVPTEPPDYLIELHDLTLEKANEEKEEYITDDIEELRRIIEKLLMEGARNISFYIDSDGYFHIIVSPSFYISEEKNVVSIQLISEEEKSCQHHLGHCPTSLLVVTNGKEQYKSTPSGPEDNNGSNTENNSDDNDSGSDQNSQEETSDSTDGNDSGNQSLDPDESREITIRYAKYWFNQYCNMHKLDPEKTNPRQLLDAMLDGKAKKSEGADHYEAEDYSQFILSLLFNLGEGELGLQAEHVLRQHQHSDINDSASLFLFHLWIGYLGQSLTFQKLYDKDKAIAKWFAGHYGSENLLENVAKIMLRGTAMSYSATVGLKEVGLVMQIRLKQEAGALRVAAVAKLPVPTSEPVDDAASSGESGKFCSSSTLSKTIGNESSQSQKKPIKRKRWDEDEEFSQLLVVLPAPKQKRPRRKGKGQPLP